jgi:hypothetical protein
VKLASEAMICKLAAINISGSRTIRLLVPAQQVSFGLRRLKSCCDQRDPTRSGGIAEWHLDFNEIDQIEKLGDYLTCLNSRNKRFLSAIRGIARSCLLQVMNSPFRCAQQLNAAMISVIVSGVTALRGHFQPATSVVLNLPSLPAGNLDTKSI